MNKIDLIIAALQKLDNQAQVNNMDLIAEALTAARELRQELAKPDEKPEWQELYKDEVFAILAGDDEWSSLEFAQSISDLLREKNT